MCTHNNGSNVCVYAVLGWIVSAISQLGDDAQQGCHPAGTGTRRNGGRWHYAAQTHWQYLVQWTAAGMTVAMCFREARLTQQQQ